MPDSDIRSCLLEPLQTSQPVPGSRFDDADTEPIRLFATMASLSSLSRGEFPPNKRAVLGSAALDRLFVDAWHQLLNEALQQGIGLFFVAAEPLQIFGDGRRNTDVSPTLIVAADQAIFDVDQRPLKVGAGDIRVTDKPVIIQIVQRHGLLVGTGDVTQIVQPRRVNGAVAGQHERARSVICHGPALRGKTALRAMNAGVHVLAGEDDRHVDFVTASIGVTPAGKFCLLAQDSPFFVAHFERFAPPFADELRKIEGHADRLIEELFREQEDDAHSRQKHGEENRQPVSNHTKSGWEFSHLSPAARPRAGRLGRRTGSNQRSTDC